MWTNFTKSSKGKLLIVCLILLTKFQVVYAQLGIYDDSMGRLPFTGDFSVKPSLADSVLHKRIAGPGGSYWDYNTKIRYIHDLKGLNEIALITENWKTDTIRASYNLEGQMKLYSSSLYGGIKNEYIYDEKGRILKISSEQGYSQYYYYTNSEKDSIVDFIYDSYSKEWYKNEKKEVIYNPLGYCISYYIFNNDLLNYEKQDVSYEYIFDNQHRLLSMNAIDGGQEMSFQYTEDGYICFENNISGSRYKFVYQYNEHGDLIKKVWFVWSGYWILVTEDSYHYYYPSTTQNELIKSDGINIMIEKGYLSISVTSPVTMYLYSINGRILKKIEVENLKRIPLPQGIYIVHVKNYSKKVFVR